MLHTLRVDHEVYRLKRPRLVAVIDHAVSIRADYECRPFRLAKRITTQPTNVRIQANPIFKELPMKTAQSKIYFYLIAAAFAAGITLTGCDNKETILDVETPGGGVEVERDRDDGSIDVDVDE